MRADLLFKLLRPDGVFKVDVEEPQWRIVSSHLPATELAHLNQTLTRIRQAHPGARFSRTFPMTVNRLREIDGPDAGDRELALFFRIGFPDEQEAYDAARELQMEALTELGEILGKLRNTCSGAQEYIERSIHGGVGAIWAWGFPGGKGENVTICVIDGGWDDTHPDLQPADILYLGQVPGAPVIPHGTNVAGVLAGQPSPTPLTGVAHGSRIRFSSNDNPGGTIDAIDGAVSSGLLGNGDVLLLEQELANIGQPLEANASFMAIFETAATLGITVVEPAGNSRNRVENPPSQPPWPPVFEPAPAGVREAVKTHFVGTRFLWPVMVGAGDTPQPPTGGWGPKKWIDSNYGSRVDCQGWGACVLTTRTTTTGWGPTYWYWNDFGGTSAASANVAGVVAIMQSMRKAAGLAPLSPYEVRTRLRDNANGLPQPPADEALWHIGPQPDLRKLLAMDFAFPMVTTLRPFLDHWAHHPWVSPYIFPRKPPPGPPDPGPLFGNMESWRDDPGETIAPSERGVIYLRLLNGSPFEESVCADLYWAHPGTYLGPASWLGNSIGRVEMQLPRGREEPGVAVSAGIPWIAPATTSDPSLIAVFTSRWDETPLGAYSPDADYIATVHRVAHRNLIRLPHAEGPWFWRFRLRMPRMALLGTTIQLATDLPEGTRLYIGLPPGREGSFQMDASTKRHKGDALLETRFGANTGLALERLWKPGGDLVGADHPPEVWLECDASRPSFPRFGLRPGEEVPIVIGVERLEGRRSVTITIDQFVILPTPVERDEPVLVGRLMLEASAAESSTE